MKYLVQLLKGFVRSSVNQVGRDGGKIISNKVYGDAHSTPIRQTEESVRIVDAEHLNSGYKVKELSIGNSIAGMYLMSLIPLYGYFYLFIRGLEYLFKKKTIMHKFLLVDRWREDKRFTNPFDDRLYLGKESVEDVIEVGASKKERKSYIIRGVIHLTYFIIWNLFAYFVVLKPLLNK